jgi:hypothetical protein
VTRLLLVIVAWRLMRRLLTAAIVVALAMVLIHGGSFTPRDPRHAAEAVERILQPIAHHLQRTLGRTFRP